MKSNKPLQAGFTLIEMIVSLAVFSVVITITVGALLVLIATNQQLQDEQTVMTNLSFAVDSMTREIRTGTNYVCFSANSLNAAIPGGDQPFRNGEVLSFSPILDCQTGNDSRRYHGISFVESGQSITGAANTRIVYFFNGDDNRIYRRISGRDAEPVTSSGIEIVNAEFFVTGTEKLIGSTPAADTQPVVTIVIEARDASADATKTHVVQTTVTQRSLDI